MPNDNREKMFNRLMASQGPAELSAAEALEQVGLLIDLSGDLAREEGTARALLWAEELERGSLSAADAALLKYFRGNAWANRQKARHGDRSAVWAWEQPELQQQLLSVATCSMRVSVSCRICVSVRYSRTLRTRSTQSGASSKRRNIGTALWP